MQKLQMYVFLAVLAAIRTVGYRHTWWAMATVTHGGPWLPSHMVGHVHARS